MAIDLRKGHSKKEVDAWMDRAFEQAGVYTRSMSAGIHRPNRVFELMPSPEIPMPMTQEERKIARYVGIQFTRDPHKAATAGNIPAQEKTEIRWKDRAWRYYDGEMAPLPRKEDVCYIPVYDRNAPSLAGTLHNADFNTKPIELPRPSLRAVILEPIKDKLPKKKHFIQLLRDEDFVDVMEFLIKLILNLFQ